MKPMKPLLLAIISLILRPAICGYDKNKEVTMIIQAGTVNCFYEKIRENFVLDFDYQVRKSIN